MDEPTSTSISSNNEMIRKESYFTRRYLELEKERLWPRVWQPACRLEEIPRVGNFVTYDIADESLIVVRTASDEIKAYHNVCQHRGRRLTEGCGRTQKFHCRFHGWQWNLDGSNARVVDREDWCGELDGVDLSLKTVETGMWGGWVFVCMDRDSETFEEFLAPVQRVLAPFEIEKMRYGWRKWLRLPCNWKIALEAFNEGYHVRTTHSQVLRWSDDRSESLAYGKHSMFGYPEPDAVFGTGSKRLGNQISDTRQSMADFYAYQKKALNALMTDSMMRAAQRLPDLPKETSAEAVLEHLMAMSIEEDAKQGVEWPMITPEQLSRAGTDWHVFPNLILLPMHTNCLGYRCRPDGDDPESCIFEVFHLERFPDGKEPVVENLQNSDLDDEDFWGEILLQDFQQMQDTHRGMKSRGFEGPRTNPRQERSLRNFHRTYHQYLGDPS